MAGATDWLAAAVGVATKAWLAEVKEVAALEPHRPHAGRELAHRTCTRWSSLPEPVRRCDSGRNRKRQ